MKFSFLTALIYLVCGIILVLLGFLIFREDVQKRLNRITGAMLFLAALGPLLGAFGMLLENATPKPEVDLEFLNRLYLVWEFFFPQLVLFSLVFPFEHPVLKSHPGLPFVLFAPQSFHLLLMLILPDASAFYPLVQWLDLAQQNWPLLLQPFRILLRAIVALLEFMATHHETYFSAINMAYVLTAIAVMHFGYQKIKNLRLLQQVRWVLWGICASLGLYAVAFLLPQISPLEIERNLAHLLTVLSLILGSGAIAWAIIRYQFLDVRFIIRRGFVYSITSGMLVGVYLLIYSNTKSVVKNALGVDLPIVEVFFLILAVIVFQPILGFVESTVERFFFKEGQDYQQLLHTLSRDLARLMDLEQLQEKITRTLREALVLESAHLIIEKRANSAFTTGLVLLNSAEAMPAAVQFERNGPFLALMARMELPASPEDIVSHLSDAQERESLARLKPKLLLPLNHHDELAGVLLLGAKITQEPFSYEDMTFLSLLSNQVAIAIENTRLYQEKLARQRIDEELRLAREIQSMLLPRAFPLGHDFEVSAINLPSLEVGGDYYDFIELPGGLVGIAVGDVSGKGVPGAILMSNLQAVFRASATRSLHSNQVMHEINQQLTRTTTAGKYATFFYGILSPARRALTYTNAGHNYPILVRCNGELCELPETDLVIGVRDAAGYCEHMIAVAPGEMLVLYTDGVTEAYNREEQQFGMQRLFETIRAGRNDSAEDLRNRIYEAVLKFSEDMPQADDLTLVVVKMT